MARSPMPYRHESRTSPADFLRLDRTLTSTVTHLIYWAGLGLIALIGFGVVGAFVGAALREPSLQIVLLAIPGLVGGLLAMLVLVLVWRWMCEFYVAVFQIAEDLRALRLQGDQGAGEL